MADHDTHAIRQRFADFIGQKSYPCVGAKSALAKQQIRHVIAYDIQSSWNDLEIIAALTQFARDYARQPNMFQSFVVSFSHDPGLTEMQFETALWQRIQSLHEKDRYSGYAYDDAVDADPQHPEFSLSFGGQAFFVVGLHPNANRKARRFDWPTMVFNLHDQFERLRNDGLYHKMRETILQRDRSWSGSINPMLAEHGTISEARQYSGRAVGDDWTCPFRPALRDDAASRRNATPNAMHDLIDELEKNR